MAILVTGAAGFIGSHLVERLLESDGPRLVCLDDFNDFYDPARKRANVQGFASHPRVRMIAGTFCDAEAMRRLFDESAITHVVHLGAHAGVRTSIQTPMMYVQANVTGTLSLLEAARYHPVERFLLVSSSTVYGRGAAVPFVEDAVLGAPLSPYGATKRAAELLARTYLDLHQVNVVCLRPFSVYGPRLRPDLALAVFARALVEGRSLPLFGDGSIRRDFTHVSDICAGLQAALVMPNVIGETINLGHAEPIEMRQVIELLAQALGKPGRIDYLPEQPGEMPVTFADLSKARRLLGYAPQVAFADGVREYADWFLGHGT